MPEWPIRSSLFKMFLVSSNSHLANSIGTYIIKKPRTCELYNLTYLKNTVRKSFGMVHLELGKDQTPGFSHYQ
jgi:hypothetical protein